MLDIFVICVEDLVCFRPVIINDVITILFRHHHLINQGAQKTLELVIMDPVV